MKTIFKIMQSGFDYDHKSAEQMRTLHYAHYNNIPSIEVAGMAFYELKDLLSMPDLSTTKQNKLSKSKPGSPVQLFNVGRNRYYYAVQLNDKEQIALDDLNKEKDEVDKLNKQIEEQVGHLLKDKKDHEKKMDALKKVFK
jgi:uncharacterized protein YaiL (DUF2058 family)